MTTVRCALRVSFATLLCAGSAFAQPVAPTNEAAAPPPANPPATAAPDPAQVPAAAPSAASSVGLEHRLAALEEEVRTLRARAHAPPEPKPPTPPRPVGWEAFWPWVMPAEGLSFGGYLQSQYESHQESQDQVFQGGALQNKDRFSIRRARLNVSGEWDYAAFAVEMDANTTNGPQVDLRKAEASLQYRPDRKKPPIVIGTLGQFDTPFGYELVESPRTRWFTERSALSRAFWPGEPDLGVRMAGALGFFRWTIAPMNGHPIGESSPYALQDPIGAKDVVFRFGVDVTPREDFQIAGGLSAVRGRGFHAGTDATKPTIQWVDINNNGLVESGELIGTVGRSATPSQTYDRWAAGADLRAHLRTCLGVTKVYGEIVVASNMDRGTFVADPISTGAEQRELGFYAGLVQEIGPYGVVGLRFDYYDPNSDALFKRQGRVLPVNQAISTWSPLVGVTLPDRARLLFQYDGMSNSLARDPGGVPTHLKNDIWTVRLQVQL